MPYAAPSRCSEFGCSEFVTRKGRCDEHQNSGWVERRRGEDDRTTMDRLGITETAWQRLKAKVMRDQQGLCHWCGNAGATEVDHIMAVTLGGAKTDESNLAPIHSDPCHREKTSRELVEARRRKRRRR